MQGEDQPLTQNMTFEIGVKSLTDLEAYAKTFDCKIDDFLCDETEYVYRYYYIEIPGPGNICKVEISYCHPE
jgi:hypothetical protein